MTLRHPVSIALSIHSFIYFFFFFPLSIHPSLDLSIYLSIHPFDSLSIHFCIHPSIHPWIYLSIHSSMHLSIYGVPSTGRILKIIGLFCIRALSKRLYFLQKRPIILRSLLIIATLYLSIYPSIYLSINSSVHPSICLSTYIYISFVYDSTSSARVRAGSTAECDMKYACLWRASFMRGTWLPRVHAKTARVRAGGSAQQRRVWHDSYIAIPSDIYVCVLCVWHNADTCI